MKYFIKDFKNKKNVRFMSFDDMYDVKTHIDNSKWETNETHSKRDRSDWYGNASYEEAIDMLETGFDITKCKEYDSVKKDIKENYKDAIQPQRITNINHVVGFQPIVPNALLNLPKSMITQDRKVNRKVINLFIAPSGLSHTSSEKYLKYNTLIRNIVETIEQKTPHKFNIYVYNYSERRYEDRVNEVVSIKVKHSNETFNFRKHGFIMGHAAFQRRILFRVSEVNPWKAQMDYGYGTHWGLDTAELEELLRGVVKISEGETNIIIPNINDVDLSGDYLTKAYDKYFKEVIEK